MKRIFVAIIFVLVALLLVGCNDPAPTATIEPEGTEDIIVEDVIIEDTITTWDNVPTQTWD